MRYCALGMLMLAIAAFSCDEARAQRGQGRGGFGGRGQGGNSLYLLTQKSVQDELKLSADQIAKAEEAVEKQRGDFAELRDLSREERQKKMEERAKANQAVIAEILKEDQLKRLKQIVLQQRGATALGDPEIATALNLTSEQKDRITAIQEAAQNEMRDLYQAGAAGGDRQELQKKVADLRNAANEKASGVLTPEQQTKWKQLVGEPFKGEIRPPQRGGNRAAARLNGRLRRTTRSS